MESHKTGLYLSKTLKRNKEPACFIRFVFQQIQFLQMCIFVYNILSQDMIQHYIHNKPRNTGLFNVFGSKSYDKDIIRIGLDTDKTSLVKIR